MVDFPKADRLIRSIVLGTAATTVLAAMTGAGFAQEATVIDGSDFDRSGWLGAAFYEPAVGRFDYCRQGRAFDNGAILTFTLDGSGSLDLGVVDETWGREVGATVPAAARLDEYGPVDLVGVVDSPTGISFPLGDNPQIVDAFRSGNVFEVVGEDFGPLSFGLAGTSASLSSLRNCVSTYREIALTPSLGEQGRRMANALAGYPEDIQRAVLDATLNPDLIGQIAEIQAASSETFRALIDSQPQDVQTLVWRVVRYPDLIDGYMDGETPEEGAYPESALEAGQTLVNDHPDLIDQVRAIRVEAEQEASEVLRGQPIEVEATFRTLLDYPEIMSGMAANLEIIEQVGTRWAEDSEAIWQALEATIAETNGAEDAALASWEEQIANNPEAAEEMVEAADQYVAQMSEANPTYAALNTDPSLYADPSYVEDPYPYWYGTPPQETAYAPASWYPVPYYDDTGFTVSDAGELILTGLVSVAFVSWLFDEIDDDDDYYYWWGRYPHFSEEIFINVEDNVIIIGDTSEFVDNWRDRREEYLPDDWFDDDGRLADRLEELGDFERDFRQEGGRLGEGDLDAREFLEQRREDYPALQEARERDGGLRDRADGDGPALGAAGGDSNLTGLADRLGDRTGDVSRPAASGDLSSRDLSALQGGPNNGGVSLGDRDALDQQLGSNLADRLTGGGSAGTGVAATPPVASAPALERDPNRQAIDRFNGGQLGSAPNIGQPSGGGSGFGGGGLFGGGERTQQPRTTYQPQTPNLPRSGGGFADRHRGGGGGLGGGGRGGGGGNFQNRFR